jgi:hypothetical protein
MLQDMDRVILYKFEGFFQHNSLYFCSVIKQMDKTVNNRIHTALGWFLLVLFFGALVIKPVHILVAHHNLPDIAIGNGHHNVLSNRTHQECAICDFEFYNFIPQDQVQLPQVTIFLSNELAAKTVACFASQSVRLSQLRAPPAL